MVVEAAALLIEALRPARGVVRVAAGTAGGVIDCHTIRPWGGRARAAASIHAADMSMAVATHAARGAAAR